MASITLPMVIVFCLAAFGLVVLLYLCMQRLRKPPEDRRREVRFEEMFLPGEPRDTRHRLSYLLLNCANTVNVDMDYPKFEHDIDRSEALQEYRLRHINAPLTARGHAQAHNAREGMYKEYLDRVVCAYAANTQRCLETASELLCVGGNYTKADKKAPRCPSRVVPVDPMSQFGVTRVEPDGRVAPAPISKEYESLEDLIAEVGTNECDLATLYDQKAVLPRSTRSIMKTYTKPSLFCINRDLTTENRNALQQLKHPSDKEDIVLIVGQSPYINALAVYISDIMGHSIDKRRSLEEVNLGDLDGFLITRKPGATIALDFDDRQEDIDNLLSSATNNAIPY